MTGAQHADDEAAQAARSGPSSAWLPVVADPDAAEAAMAGVFEAARGLPELPVSADGLLGAAWGLILSAGDGDWAREHPDWAAAARRWSDRYREYLGKPAPRD